MNKLTRLLPLLMLTLFATAAKAQSAEKMIKDWERAKNYTKLYLDSMPEEGYAFKPTPEMRSFADQMLHLTDANYELGSLAAGITNPIGDGGAGKLANKSKADVTTMVLSGYDFVIAAIRNMTPGQLNQTIKVWNKYDLTRADLFDKIFEHQTHTRGQTTVYFHLKGVKPPDEILF